MLDPVVAYLNEEDALQLEAEDPWPHEPINSGETLWQLNLEELLAGLTGDLGDPSVDVNDVGAVEDDLLTSVASAPNLRHWSSSAAADRDVLAWYQPMHYWGYDAGIFVKQLAIERTAADIRAHAKYSGRPLPRDILTQRQLLAAGFFINYLHEQFHHKVESMAVRMQVVDGRHRYVRYSEAVYRRALGTDNLLEEALAEADAYKRLAQPKYRTALRGPVYQATREALKATWPCMPAGYREAARYVRKTAFEDGLRVLTGQVDEGFDPPMRPTSRWQFAPHLSSSFASVRSDIWFIVPKGKHPGLPGVLRPAASPSSKALIKIMEQHGYQTAAGGKGSHTKMTKPSNPMAIIPHGTVSPGVAAKTLRLVGYRLADLPKLERSI